MDGSKAGPLVTLEGGALLQRFHDGHVLVWTESVAIDVGFVANQEVTDLDLAQLTRMTEDRPSPMHELPSPDFGACE